MTREEIIEMYWAWADGSMTDSFYCDRSECKQWLREFNEYVNPGYLEDVDIDELAEELCRMYEEEMEEEEK